MSKDVWDIMGIVVVPVLVALIVAGIPAWVQMRRFRTENSAQHNAVTAQLKDLKTSVSNVDSKVDRVETKVDEHIGRHKENERLKAAGSW